MMDFNLILLGVGLGLLALVILFALWGFLGGLKRELSCIAVFAVLLVLAWLVFGNSGILLNYSGGLVDNLRDALNLSQKDATIWETILDYLKSIDGLNLDALLVEGKETYSFVYNIASCVATIILLVVSTLAVVIITPIIRMISHFVILIIRSVKKRKAKKQAADGVASEEVVEETTKDEEADDAVLVLKGVEGADDAVVTVSENELPAPKKTKKRVWGAIAATLKGVFLIILLFAPISGINAVLKTATPETRELISDLVEGNTEKKNVAEQDGLVDTAFNFVDEYNDSAVGKFVESSSYFFGQSLSTLLFDSMASIKTSNQNIKLRQELVVFMEAVNALEGNAEIGTWTDEQFDAALEELKDSKLLPEAMPVLVEYASEIEQLKVALDNAMQTTAFLALRDINWDKDVEIILDAVKEAYRLDVFPLKDFNVLTMNEEVLTKIVDILGDAEFVSKVLPIAIRTGVKLDAVQKIIGDFNQKLNLEDVNWKEELQSFVNIYTTFKEYGYTDIAQLTDAEVKDLVEAFVVDNFDTTVTIFEQLVDLAVFNVAIVPVAQAAIDNYLANEENEFTDFANIINLKDLTVEDWKADITSILESARLAINELDALSLDLKEMDIESDDAVEAMKVIIQKVLTLNILGDDSTKEDLLIAVITKFDLFNVDDLFIQSADGSNKVSIFDNVNWESEEGNIGEIETIMRLLDVYKHFVKLDEVNMKELSVDLIALLDSEEGVDVLVSALEELVDSELALALIDPAVNKYLLPITDKFDDDNLVKDIVNRIPNKEMAEEIINIVKAIKDAQTLGLFEVANKGLNYLNYNETEALINIINTIFDSKILKGVEGRVIRIILKATKILDIEKGLLNDINFDGEKEILVNFVHAIENVLKDPDFKLFDENGKVKLDLEYITQPEIFKQLMNGVEIILGTFERDEAGNFVETTGSKLVEALLPDVLSKYLMDLVPDDFKDLVEIIDLENMDGALLASDVRRLTYIAGQLVEMDIQTLLVNSSIVYTDKLENVYNIIDALLGMEMLKPCGDEVFAWIINYATKKLLPNIEVDEVTPEDFANVNWTNEAQIAKELISELIDFLERNELESTDKLIEFIKEKKYQTTAFVTTENADAIVKILNKALELSTLEAIAPIAFQVLVNQLITSEIIPEDFWEGNLTGEMLVEDLHSLTRIADTLINDMDFVESWRAGFEGQSISLPEAKYVNSIIDEVFDMNIVKGYENDLVQFVLEKYLPKNDIVSAESFDVKSVTDWANESTALKEVITIALDMLKDNNFRNVGEIIDLINEIKNSNELVSHVTREYITDSNINYVAKILNAAAESQLVANILPDTFEYVLKRLSKNVIDVQFINDLTASELQSDAHRIAKILNILAHEGIACVIKNNTSEIESKDVQRILSNAKLVVDEISHLNMVTKHENELMSTLINKGFSLAKLTDFTLSASDLENVDWDHDFMSIINVLSYLQEFAEDNNLVTYKNVLDYINDVSKNIKVAITDTNGRHAVNIVRELVGTGVVRALLPQLVNFAVDKAYNAGYDIRFIKDAELTNDELANDIVTLTYIAVDLLDLGIVKIYNNESVSNLDEALLKDIATQLSQLKILAKYSGEWMAFIVNFALDKLNIKDFNIRYSASNFSGLTEEQWADDTQNLGLTLVDIAKALDVLFPEGFTINQISDFIKNKEYTKQENITDQFIDCAASALSNFLAINVIDVVVTDFINYGVDKLAKVETFKDIDVQFIKNIATREILSHDVINLGEIAKTAISFGLFEYLETKTLEKVEVEKLVPIFDQINAMELFKVNRAEWMAFIANTAMKLAKVDVTYVPSDFGEITDEIANNSVESTKAVINQLAELLDMWQLDSLEDIKLFIEQKGYTSASFITDEPVIKLTEIVKEISNIVPIQSMLPKLGLYGLTKVPEKYDLSFVNPYLEDGTLSGMLLAEDIRTLMDIVVDAVEFGAIDIIYKNYENEPFEIRFEYISSIIEKIDLLHTLEVDYNSWISFASNVAFEAAKVVVRVTKDDFAYMTNEAWHEDFARLVTIVDSIAEIAKNNGLTTYADMKLFVTEKGYTSAQYVTDANLHSILDIVETLVGANLISPYLEKGLSAIIDYVVIGNEKLPDMKFVSIAIDNKEYTAELMKADLQTIIAMARNAIDFGAVELYYNKQLSEINVQPIQNIIGQINELYMFHLSEAKWMENMFEQVFRALKLDSSIYHVDSTEYSSMERADWDQDFASLVKVVGLIGELLDENYIVSSKDLMNFINNKYYKLAQYATDTNALMISEILDIVGDIKLLSPALDDLALYVVSEKLKLKDIDLSFVENALANKELTGIMISSDIKSVASLIEDAVHLGALDYVFYKKGLVLDYDLISEMIVKVANLNTVVVTLDEWAALGFNQLFKVANIDGTVTADQFAMMTKDVWQSDVNKLVEIVKKLGTLLTSNNIMTLEDVQTFFKDKLYKLAQYSNSDNALTLLEITDLVGMVRVLEPALPILAKYGISKLPTDKVDITFMIEHLDTDLTGEMLSSDIRTLSTMLKELVEFGVIDYVFYNDIENINIAKLTNAIDLLDELNIYTVEKVEWLVLGVNQLFAAMKIDESVDVSSFDGINLDEEISHLVDAINHVGDLLQALNLESVSDIRKFINDKGYINGQYVTDETLTITLDAVEDLQQMQTLKVVLPILSKWGIDKVKGEDFNFLKEAIHNDTFTADELVEDVKTIISMARKGVELGIFDALFDIDMETINGTLVAEIVAEIEELNIFNKLRPEWVALALNKALKVLDITVTKEEFSSFTEEEWKEDNQKLQNAAVKVAELFETLGLTYRTAVVDYFKYSDYKALFEHKDLIHDVLINLLETNTCDVVFEKVLHGIVVKAEKAGYDISFLEGNYHATDLINDILPMLQIAENLVNFGIKEYISSKEISSIDMTYIANAVAELENMSLFTMFRSDWVKVLVDKVLVTIKVDKNIDYSVLSLTEEEWKEDNLTLQELVLKLGEILKNNNLNKYSEVVKFFKDDKKYTLEETYTDDNLTLISDAVKLVLSFNSVENLFPQALGLAITKAYDFNLDISFLASIAKIENVRNDVDTLVQMFRPLCKFGLFELINTKSIKYLNVEYLNPVFALIPSLEIYSINEEAWAAALVNCVARYVKADFTVSEDDFVGIDWNKENELFQEMITMLDKFLVESDLVLLDNIKALKENGFKIQKQFANSTMANHLVDVVEAASNLASFNAISVDIANFAFAKLAEKGLDFTYLTDRVDNNEVTEDVKSLVEASRKVIEFGIIEQIIDKEYIDYDKKYMLYEALEKVLNLNMLEGNDNSVIISIFDKFGINHERAVGTVDFNEEYEPIVKVIDNAITILENYDIYTFEEISKIVNIMSKKINKVDRNFNENIESLANIIDVLYKDSLFTFMIMPLSEKYLAKDNLAGLADLHNIYANVADLNSDLHSLYVVLSNVLPLNIYDSLVGNVDYPYEYTFSYTNIINSLFNMNYFNMPGRMDAFVKALDKVIDKADLSGVNGNNISLADDADDIVAMMENISELLCNPDFPIKNKLDVDNKVSIPLSYFFKENNLDLEIAAIKNYMNTTLYGETGATVIILVLPLLKNVLKDYWTALDLDNYTSDMANHDAPYLMEILETFVDLDFDGIRDGSLEYSVLEGQIATIIDNLVELQLLDGHYNDLVALLLRDLVYGKTFGKFTVEDGAFSIENIDFESDLVKVKDIIHEFVELMASEDAVTMKQVSNYFKSFKVKEFVAKDNAMTKLAVIAELASQLTTVQFNSKALYEIFAVPTLSDNVKYVDYRNATNDEIYADLVKLPEIIRLAVAMNIGGIINGETIDYVGKDGMMADYVEQMLTILGTTNYVKFNLDSLLEKASEKFEGISLYGASFETLDVQGDFNKIAMAYRELVDYLSSDACPIKTINDFKALDVKQAIKDAQGYGDKIVSAYEIMSEATITPYIVPTIVRKVKEIVPTRLQSIVTVITTDDLTIEQLAADTHVSALLARHLLDSRIYRYFIDKDAILPESEVVRQLIDDVLNMYMVNTKFIELIKATLVEFNVDITDVNFEVIDRATEQEVLKNAMTEMIDAMHEYGIEYISEIKSTLIDFRDTFKVSKKDFLKKVYHALLDINAEHIVKFVETMAESQLFVETFLPVYDKALNKYGSNFGSYEEYLSLVDYSKEALASDIRIFADSIRTFYDSEFYKAYTQNAELTTEQINLAQDSIRMLGQLQILEIKKQDMVNMLGKVMKVDFSTVDVTRINVENDMNILAEALPTLYTICKEGNRFHLTINMLGNTELVNACIDVLELFFESTTSDALTPTIVRKLTNDLAKATGINFSEKTDDQVYNLCDDIIVALRALSDMGAFSNNGIDFTNKELTDKVFAVVYNNVNLRSYRKYFDKLVRNIAEYGVIDVNYEVVNHTTEVKALKAIAKQCADFIKKYKDVGKNKDYSFVSDINFQEDVTALVNKALTSNLVSQIFMPVLVGTTKVATENYGRFTMFENMTNEEFVNVALPDLFKMASYAETLGLFNKKLQYKDVDTIIALAELVVTSSATKDSLNDLLPAVLLFTMKVKIDKVQLIDADVDYVHEVDILKTFLKGIETELQNISINDPSTLLTEEFLLAVSREGKVLETSKLAKLYMKRFMAKVINKVSSTTNVLDFMLTALNDPAYTNDQAMEDYMLLLNVMEHAAYINFFGENLDYAKLNGHIDSLLNSLFALNAVKGSEEEVMRMLLSKLTFVDTSSIDLSQVSDWSSEFDSFTAMCTSFATLCADSNFDIENITSDMFENVTVQNKFVDFVDYASMSYVGSEMFKELFATKVEPNLPADAQGVIDLETLPNEKWAEEFAELFDVYVTLSKGLTNISISEVLDVYDTMFGLNGKDGLEVVKANYNEYLVRVIESVNFTTPNENVSIRVDAIPTDNEQALNEVLAIRTIIENLSTYADPTQTLMSEFDYSIIENQQDYEKLTTTLVAVSNSLAMREYILGIIGDFVNNNTDPTGQSSFEFGQLLSDEFWRQYSPDRQDYTGYDESVWTEEQLTMIAILVASANAFGLDEAGATDIYTMDLGTTYPDVTTYSNISSDGTVLFPSQVDGSDQVGLRQFLQLFALIKIFDFARFGGLNGVISTKLTSGENPVLTPKFTRPLGTVSQDANEQLAEAKALTQALSNLRELSLLDGKDITSTLHTLDSAKNEQLLLSINESVILRPMLSSLMYESVKAAYVAHTSRPEQEAVNYIESKCPSLHSQAQATEELASKEEYVGIITEYFTLLEEIEKLVTM